MTNDLKITLYHNGDDDDDDDDDDGYTVVDNVEDMMPTKVKPGQKKLRALNFSSVLLTQSMEGGLRLTV
uniref:Uncharacterized protein n=1 Tax=Glossina morsitans morsitans TaxID=37546 RepID=A0A1B0GCM3_GLOMM